MSESTRRTSPQRSQDRCVPTGRHPTLHRTGHVGLTLQPNVHRRGMIVWLLTLRTAPHLISTKEFCPHPIREGVSAR